MRSDRTMIRHATISTAFSLWRHINLEYIQHFFYSIVLLNHVSRSQPEPTFRDRVGVLVPLSNILLTICVVSVVFLCKLPISGSDKTVFPPILHTRLKMNFKHSCSLIMNFTCVPYSSDISVLHQDCCSVLWHLGQTAEFVVMWLSSGTSTSVGIAASYFADNM